jgi:DNA modification methylase
MKVPYTQQFTPKVTPLYRLIPILRSNTGNAKNLKTAIARAFFSDSPDPSKMAGNTLTALRNCGILEGDDLTELGQQLLDNQDNIEEAHRILARYFLLDLDAISIVETIQEMQSGGDRIDLTTLPPKLRECGFTGVSDNSSDLSGVLNWLRAAKVLTEYTVNPTDYYSLVGTTAALLNLLKELPANQVAFLKSMAALNVTDWTPHIHIVEHVEALHPGEVKFNHKIIPDEICKPLQAAGFIEYRKRSKVDQKTAEGRGGKTGYVKPAARFEKEVAPLIDALYRAAGFNQIRRIRAMSLKDIVADIKQKTDANKQGKALEYLSVRLCQMLELQFMGWRETDPVIAGGGEVDAMFYSARLIYSRWQVQCKIDQITMGTVAKEKGMQEITLANVILIVSTGPATAGAQTFRRQVIAKTNLHIIFIDGAALERIIQNNAALIEILRQQAETAIHEKPVPQGLRLPKPNDGSDTGGGKPPPAAPVPARKVPSPKAGGPTLFGPAYSTDLGQMFCGDSLQILPAMIQQGVRAKLIMTSPPFALVKKKEYGNEDAESYVRWFEPFISLFKQVLEPNGSLVIDIGGAWIKGVPAKSIYQYKLLVTLCESGFYLAQEFYHYNPAKLPTPAEWVTVRRLRVKDAVNNVFWLTLDPFADADNRRVLTEYSDSMKALLKNGYKAKLRPSGHNISTEFGRDNGGAIPPNLLQFSNTESNSSYLQRCREENIKPHPARFPLSLPEFFIKFLTRPGDLVLDPMAGSNTTGAAAERLGRRWIGIEENLTYVEGSELRFKQPKPAAEPITSPAVIDIVQPPDEMSLFTTP